MILIKQNNNNRKVLRKYTGHIKYPKECISFNLVNTCGGLPDMTKQYSFYLCEDLYREKIKTN